MAPRKYSPKKQNGKRRLVSKKMDKKNKRKSSTKGKKKRTMKKKRKTMKGGEVIKVECLCFEPEVAAEVRKQYGEQVVSTELTPEQAAEQRQKSRDAAAATSGNQSGQENIYENQEVINYYNNKLPSLDDYLAHAKNLIQDFSLEKTNYGNLDDLTEANKELELNKIEIDAASEKLKNPGDKLQSITDTKQRINYQDKLTQLKIVFDNLDKQTGEKAKLAKEILKNNLFSGVQMVTVDKLIKTAKQLQSVDEGEGEGEGDAASGGETNEPVTTGESGSEYLDVGPSSVGEEDETYMKLGSTESTDA